MFYCYILKSEINNSYYVGSTSNLKVRLDYHNKGRSKYTRTKRPWKLLYYEEFSTLSLARQREKQVKSWKSREAVERLIRLNGSFV